MLWVILNFIIFFVSLLLIVSFLGLFYVLKAEFKKEKQLQGSDHYAQFLKTERIINAVVLSLVSLFLINSIIYSVVKPVLFL